MKAITTRFVGPTNTKGSRIIASDEDGNRVTWTADHALRHEDRHADAAVALARKMGWTGTLVRGGIKGGYVFVWLGDERDQFVVPSAST